MFSLSLIIGLIVFACSDPNTIGLEIQPSSDSIIISSLDFEDFNSITESEDSLRTDETANLILGEIDHISDPEFGANRSGFFTQVLLQENNIDLGTNPIVDSVVLSYTYSGYYGDIDDFTNLEVNQIFVDLFKDSLYYSNSFDMPIGNVDNVASFNLSDNSETPFLRVKLKNDFGQKILDLGNNILKDNETFLQDFKGISVFANAANTMLYLNPEGSDSYLKIFYHNEQSNMDTLSVDFKLGGDAARVNLFNNKSLSNLNQDIEKMYIQSMAGYKVKISINNKDSIKSLLDRKAINKVIISFDVAEDSQSKYQAHERLVLVRLNEDGENVFLSDLIVEGDDYFGGDLASDSYEFNITSYFSQLLDNDTYNNLYLLPAGAAVNANRTILHKEIKLQIYYSEL